MAPILQSCFSILDDSFKGKYMTISSFQQEDFLFYSFLIVCPSFIQLIAFQYLTLTI